MKIVKCSQLPKSFSTGSLKLGETVKLIFTVTISLMIIKFRLV